MGDLIGEIVDGTLYFVPFDELSRISKSILSPVNRAGLLANASRINALFMIARAGSGHIGSSFSSMEMMSFLYTNEVYPQHSQNISESGDVPKAIFFSSKGHDAPAMYSILIGLGILPEAMLGELRKLDGLPGHPDVGTPGIVTNTGSLGMGVSKAKGFIKANRLQNKFTPVYVLTGDGELQEGQFWESLISAVNNKMHELTVLIDHNKLQSDTLLSKVNDLGDLEAKLLAFGFHVERCDGNDLDSFAECISNCKSISDRPKAIIADTIKGRGVSFMEHTSIDSDIENYKFHSGAPTAENYHLAVIELLDTANRYLESLGMGELRLQAIKASQKPKTSKNIQRLIPAYSSALVEIAEARDEIVALDADLILDTGLMRFSERFQDRFIECGIAEQDMVSQAGALALSGKLPIVHSFACFLAARPREQIYNNATENTKVIYVGSLAGILPGGPGHSHQGINDIGALGHIPGLQILVPGCESDVKLLLKWACEENEQSSYLRLESIPVDLNFHYEPAQNFEFGKGISITADASIKLITYGPTMLSVALEAAKLIQQRKNLDLEVINFPWVNAIDKNWLRSVVEASDRLVVVDNHFSKGALADRVCNMAVDFNLTSKRIIKIGLNEIPASGANEELLQRHGLDANSIVSQIIRSLN